jgi:hypothetical protein
MSNGYNGNSEENRVENSGNNNNKNVNRSNHSKIVLSGSELIYWANISNFIETKLNFYNINKNSGKLELHKDELLENYSNIDIDEAWELLYDLMMNKGKNSFKHFKENNRIIYGLKSKYITEFEFLKDYLLISVSSDELAKHYNKEYMYPHRVTASARGRKPYSQASMKAYIANQASRGKQRLHEQKRLTETYKQLYSNSFNDEFNWSKLNNEKGHSKRHESLRNFPAENEYTGKHSAQAYYKTYLTKTQRRKQRHEREKRKSKTLRGHREKL